MHPVVEFILERLDVIGLALAFGGLIFWLGRRMGRIEKEFQGAFQSIDTLMGSYSFLLGALVAAGTLKAEKLLDVMKPFEELSRINVQEFISNIAGKENPITSENLDRLREIVDKSLKDESLSYEEATDGYRLSRELLEEAKAKEDEETIKTARVLWDYFAYLLGQATAEPETA